MAVDLQAATPDTSVPAAAFLFGADSQAASAPSVYAGKDFVSAMVADLSGVVKAPDGGSSAPTFSFTGETNTGVYRAAPRNLGFAVNSIPIMGMSDNGGNVVRIVGAIEFTTNIGNGGDVALYRDAADTLALRRSTNAQTFRVYNTYTDASNYERGKFAWESNTLVIGAEKAGTGVQRGLRLDVSGGTGAGITLKSDVSGYIDNTFGSTVHQRFITTGIHLQSTQGIVWAPTTVTVSVDLAVSRSAAGILSLTNGSTGGATFEMTEQTAPSAPAANKVRIYAEDNGAGKTRLMARFATGAAQQLAIEP